MMNPGCINSNPAVEESRRLIDQKKVELFEMIRRLNSKRNELAPISVLPPELLGRIFDFVYSERHPDNQERQEYRRSPPFISTLAFTYVSQQWRNVALDTPRLWDSPPIIYPTWARAMLQRSKMADLVIHAIFPDDTGAIVIKDIFIVIKDIFDNYAARVREIDLRWLTSSSLSCVLENVQPSSLRVRSLRLTAFRDWMTDDQGVPVFPAHLLVQPGELRRLRIEHFAFDLYAQPQPLLTHLTVEKPRDRPLLSEFVPALSEMPALETLVMIDSLPLASKSVKLDLKVELPKLCYLHLSSAQNFFEVLNVLDFLIVPWTTRIDLSCTETESQPKDASVKLPDIGSSIGIFLSSLTGNLEGRSYSRLSLHSNGIFSLRAWRNHQDSRSINLSKSDLSLNLNHPEYPPCHFPDHILPYLLLSDLQTLVIDIDFTPDAILGYFGQSTTIQTVELRFNVLDGFLQALIHKPEGYETLESSYYSVSFPALQSLLFDQTTFDAFKILEVMDCLMERYERGAALQKIRIWDCFDIDSQDVGLLREIVEVEWDNLVQTQAFDGYSNLSEVLEE